MRACCGSCNQGRLPCPTPQACELPDGDGRFGAVAVILVCLILAGVLAGIIYGATR